MSEPIDTPVDPAERDSTELSVAELPATVVLSVPAHGEFVAVVRSVTASLAARCDLTVDEIDDLRIAADEAIGLLLPHATGQSQLDATFVLNPGCIELCAAVTTERVDADPDREGFAWTVLDAVTDEVEVTSTGSHLAIRLTKRREAFTS